MLTSPATHPRISRAALATTWLASIAVLLALLGAMALEAALPPRLPTSAMRQPVVIGYVHDLPGPSDQPVAIGGKRAFLVGFEGGWIVLFSVSTHRGCVVKWKPDQDVFIDPCHGSVFQRDGLWLKGPRHQIANFPAGSRDREGHVVAWTDGTGGEAEASPRDLDRIPLVAYDAAGDVLARSRSDGVLPGVPELPADAVVAMDASVRIVGTTR